MKSTTFYPNLANFAQDIVNTFDNISEDRKAQLEKISQYLAQKIARQEPIKAIVICTHNSRRSHLGQAWLQMAAAWYQVEPFHTYSGGTEATAFHPNAIQALQANGWQIVAKTDEDNPIYEVNYGNVAPLEMFSKTYDHQTNPPSKFAAIMVCTQADEGCPVVIGAEARFSLPFDDPKEFDHTVVAQTKYIERSQEIAREMFYLMSKVR
ncbi:MAG TPA: protein-tyrosine-phosphatase [Microscillaceae bacterium]|nr:protein-tyrosine-phosphatase [Microscillaceae bacterium]